jgi:hypothetical protein
MFWILLLLLLLLLLYCFGVSMLVMILRFPRRHYSPFILLQVQLNRYYVTVTAL